MLNKLRVILLIRPKHWDIMLVVRTWRFALQKYFIITLRRLVGLIGNVKSDYSATSTTFRVRL